jgi:predicted metal-dependent phosphoesterase TrpH
MTNDSLNLIDLHTHSRYSDGSLSPRELVRLARQRGLCAIALTDHDTMAGVEEALEAGEEFAVEVVPGVEISAEHSPGTMHILGYYLDSRHTELEDALKRLRQARAYRNPRIIERLRNLGLEITYSEVMTISGGQVGRPHIAKALVNRGYVADINEAFARYLSKGGPAYVEKFRFHPEDAIALIRRAGGLAALAHPSTLATDRADELDSLVARLRATGLEGIEIFYPEHTEAMTVLYQEIARRHGLICTGGSDFHGDLKNGTPLGGDEKGPDLPYALLQVLKEKLQERRER